MSVLHRVRRSTLNSCSTLSRSAGYSSNGGVYWENKGTEGPGHWGILIKEQILCDREQHQSATKNLYKNTPTPLFGLTLNNITTPLQNFGSAHIYRNYLSVMKHDEQCQHKVRNTIYSLPTSTKNNNQIKFSGKTNTLFPVPIHAGAPQSNGDLMVNPRRSLPG